MSLEYKIELQFIANELEQIVKQRQEIKVY